MQKSNFFRIICEDIHSTIIATVDDNGLPVSIYQNNCLHCGNCFRDCPVNAVAKRG